MRRLLLAGCLAAAPVWAAGGEVPLTLEAVLAQADAAHPDLELVRAQETGAKADAQLADSLNDFRVTLEASLRGGRNETLQNRWRDDNYARLNARKTLLDGSRQASGSAAALAEAEARGLQLLDARAQRRIALMARYFDVLLAEMQHAAETEYTAVAYVAWDQGKDRQSLGQLAQWELAEDEARYLDARARRSDSLRVLRSKRLALGLALNQVGAVNEDLKDPELKDNERKLPELDALLERALAGNSRLQAQKRMLAAAVSRLGGVRAERKPSLEFEAEAARWSRTAATRDDLRAGVNLVWPLWQGGRDDARLAREQARFHELQAQHDKLVQELRQAALDGLEEIQQLRDGERRSAEVQSVYRNLGLERAQAEYEMERKTNLGASLAQTQTARIRKRGIEYRLALAWARLDALLGEQTIEGKK
ncbi:MAG: TolC family protein [Betaproteobacteria bacterium]|nr:TolC family protein [Betaproteobacteria bacterium]